MRPPDRHSAPQKAVGSADLFGKLGQMGGFGSGRYGASPTAEATASYILDASILTTALRRGPRLSGTIQFGERFPVGGAIDVADPEGPFVKCRRRFAMKRAIPNSERGSSGSVGLI